MARAVGPAGGVGWAVSINEDFVVDEVVCGVADVVAEDGAAGRFASKVREGDCVHVVIDLGRAADVLRARNQAARMSEDVVVASPDLWLWHPVPPRGGRLVVDLPKGFSMSAPFPVDDDGAYVVDASTWAFASTVAVGALKRHTFAQGGARFDVVILPGDLTMVRADVDRWIDAAARAVSLGRDGRFPVPAVQVVVDPVVGAGVPFGMVQRGGGPHAVVLLGERSQVGDVVGEWVLVHEFAHLLMPPPALADTWWGEGTATYYQSVLRGRAGLIDTAEAWEELRNGLERGRAASTLSTSLLEASRDMRKSGRYLQVYWGGAAIALLLDVELRRCSDVTLDEVLASFRAEQPTIDVRRVAARDIVRRASAAGPGCAQLGAVVDAALAAPFPDVGGVLDDLGVGVDGLDDSAPLASVRRAITAPPP